jgi:hypothetical protein
MATEFCSPIEHEQRHSETADQALYAAACAFVDRLTSGQLPDALLDKKPLWHAWALRAAFEHGASWANRRTP